jgi:hypothetical protein
MLTLFRSSVIVWKRNLSMWLPWVFADHRATPGDRIPVEHRVEDLRQSHIKAKVAVYFILLCPGITLHGAEIETIDFFRNSVTETAALARDGKIVAYSLIQDDGIYIVLLNLDGGTP